jgi:hypothetical protein
MRHEKSVETDEKSVETDKILYKKSVEGLRLAKRLLVPCVGRCSEGSKRRMRSGICPQATGLPYTSPGVENLTVLSQTSSSEL